MSLFFELILGTLAFWHGRRWLVARLDENFGDSPENFDTDDPQHLPAALICVAAFFGTFSVLALGFPTFRAPGLALLISVAAVSVSWIVGNLSNWRRLERGNPLRSPLDSVLSLDGRRPSKVRLRRSWSILPRFALDGALEIPSTFIRSVPCDEQYFLYQVVRNRKAIAKSQIALLLAQMGIPLLISYLAVVYLRFPSWFTFLWIPVLNRVSTDFSKKYSFSEEDYQRALMQTNDFDAAERVIRRILSVEDANKRVTALREWWATQTPANPTVSTTISQSSAPTQRVGWGP